MESDVYPTQKRGVPAYQGKNYHELLAYVDSVANVYLDNLWWHIVYGTWLIATYPLGPKHKSHGILISLIFS